MAVNDRAMGYRCVLANGDGGAGFGENDHTVLNVGVGSNCDRLHITRSVDLIGANHRVRADKHVVVNDTLPQIMAVLST